MGKTTKEEDQRPPVRQKMTEERRLHLVLAAVVFLMFMAI